MKWHKTEFRGVRYRKHSIRKHGVKFDRYFAIRYQIDGQRREEGLGWASGDWSAEKAALTLAELKKAHKIGEGPTSLKEKRNIAKERKTKAARNQITFEKIFTDQYYPQAQADKDPQSYKREKSLFKKWINPVIGALPLRDVAPIHLEKIKKNMKDADLSERSREYALAVIRQVFNFSYRNNLFNGDNPVRKVKIPKSDNKRLRFLTPEEADTLLNSLKVDAPELWEQSLISLHAGFRASEIFRLTLADLNFEQGTLTAKNSKGKKTRFGYMTQEIKQMLLNKKRGEFSALLYPGPDGKEKREVSSAFQRIVKKLGLNNGIEDRRDKVVFHTCRHTYASWLVQNGEDLYKVKERLGHGTLAMTERYAHLAPGSDRGTVKTIENYIYQSKNGKVVDIIR